MISNRWYEAMIRKVTTFRRDQRDVQRHRFRPVLELLEDRRLMATITVTSAFDDGSITEDGKLTLREAIESINQGSNVNADVNADVSVNGYGTKDTILFNIVGGNTITITGQALQAISQQLTINGSNLGTGGNIELTNDDTFTGDGLTLTSGSADSVIRGLVINGFEGNGIVIKSDVSGVLIEGNFIGTNTAGDTAVANTGSGIRILGSNNTVGGTGGVGLGIGKGNLISGNNGDGVTITDSEASGNLVIGNFIGTDLAGDQSLGNGLSGVSISSRASGNTIGGSSQVTLGGLTGAGNLISANGQNGITLFFAGNNRAAGNFIGTDVTGTKALGNLGHGVEQSEGSRGNTIGGVSIVNNAGDTFLGNLISGNDDAGVKIAGSNSSSNLVQGNFIGTDVSGTVDDDALGNNGAGIVLEDSPFNTIGGASSIANGRLAGPGNLISNNLAEGVLITRQKFSLGGFKNQVEGNFIGTDISGTAALGNDGNGVTIDNSVQNRIGGSDPIAASGTFLGNLISGNGENGVKIEGSAATQNLIQGNFVGTQVNGKVALGNDSNGVVVQGSDDNTIAGNLISGNGDFSSGSSGSDGHGILLTTFFDLSTSAIDSADGNTIQGNFIGTNKTGTGALPNARNGILIEEGQDNLIGGASKPPTALLGTGLGNLISGNTKDGVLIQGESADFNKVQGNIIGLAINGDTKLGNGRHGVYLYEGASGNTIGGKSSSEGNVISGNAEDGVLIKAFGVSQPEPKPTQRNVVQNNFIGTDSKGTKDRGNQGNGVTITNGVFSSTDGTGADFNTIGGALGQGNIIAFNKGTGVLVGVEPDDDVVNNSILANSIYSNGNLGIDLGGDGPTKNDLADPDPGPNFFQNFPLLKSIVLNATTGKAIITFDFDSIDTGSSLAGYYFEFFANDSAIPAAAEGQRFIGAKFGLVGKDLTFEFDIGLIGSARFITATATFVSFNEGVFFFSTSEFSEVVELPLIPPVVTTPGGDPIVVRILQSGVEAIVPPVAVAALQEIVVSGLPPLPPPRLLAPLPVEQFQPLVDAPGEIHGQILDDPNALGKPGPDTFPLHGQPVYIDFNRNGEYDDGEPITVTNGKGEYTFTSLTAGQYTVHLLLGRTQDVTFSPKQDNKIELRSGNMIITNVNFGVRFRARRGPGGRSSLPGAADGLPLADQSVLPHALEEGSLEALRLPLETPELPVAAEPVPLAEAGDSVLSDLLRWGTWLLGAAVVVPWRQLANRRRQ